MAVFKVNHNLNYSVISNAVFKDTRLSWKAKGILANMLSLPDGWDYSMAGLEALASDGISATRSALKELEEYGYLVRRKIRGEQGKIVDWEYIIYEAPVLEKPQVEKPQVEKPQVEKPQVEKPQVEKPQVEKPQVEKPQVEKPQVENRTQLNTNNINNLNNKILNNKILKNNERTNDYETIIEREVKFAEIKSALFDFIKMRKLIKKPMTDRALQLLIVKLRKLSNGDKDVAVEILNQSILNNWQGIYAVKDATRYDSNNYDRCD